MALLFFLIFAAIWYLPLFLKHRKITVEPAKYYIFAFLLGIAAGFGATVIQIGYAGLLYVLGIVTSKLPTIIRLIVFTLKTLIIIALVEEFMKYLGGRTITKRIPDISKAGCMLIFGMVGIGFEFMESVMSGAASSIFVGVLRGITDLHIFWQIWMGMYLWEAWEAKKQNKNAEYKKNVSRAMLVPIAVHFVYDWLTMEGNSLLNIEDNDFLSMLGILCMLGFIIIALIYIIITLRKAHKVLKAESSATCGDVYH